MHDIRTIDCHYMGAPGVAATYLFRAGPDAVFVETNTSAAVPRMLAALAHEGLSPEQVKYIIITHVHLDHAGGAGALLQACPNAILLAHPRAAPHAIDPSRLVTSATAVYGAERFAALYGEVVPVPAERVRIMADGETLELHGRTLTFLHTRGHANHHFVVHDTGSDAVFTGDAFGVLYPALQTNGTLAFPSTSPTDFDPAAAREAVHRIVATGAVRVFPTHMGEHTEIDAIAGMLDTQLLAAEAVLDEADASGLDGEALDRFCAERVHAGFVALLSAHGLADDPRAWEVVAIDEDLNAQGVAFAVRKRRYKRARAAT
ncbi:MAG: glyoxylase-like metal-dependent hydrolase (beta-lactamase superfamily II) [Myxococcota bacterium]|jgi:glyoxylase-like metal-dependent hydrolase (beta-lactamase superfamily II)